MVSGQHTTGDPLSSRTSVKSFCTLLSRNFQPKSPSSFRGKPAICFSKEEISQFAAPLRYTLIGKFNYRRPKMEVIKKFFISLGLKSLKSVGLLHENHIAIFISQEEDYSRLLLRSTWYISGASMKVLKWSPDFHPSFESPAVPIWVGFPGLPLHLFEKSALFSIASVFGSPLKMDEPTALLSRPTVARVCIEVDVSKPLNHRLWVGDEKDGYWQDVVFENPPLYCGFCKALGHEERCCYFKNPSLKSDLKKHSMEKELPAPAVQEQQKGKEKGKQEMVWKHKVKAGLIPETADEGDWTVVRRKNRKPVDNTPSSFASGAVVVKDAGTSKFDKPSSSQIPAAEEKPTKNGRASVVPERAVQTVESVDKTGDPLNPASDLLPSLLPKYGGLPSKKLESVATFPPLLQQHLSLSGLALTPFPVLANKKGKGVKDSSGEPSEPLPVKTKDVSKLSPFEKFQTSSQLKLIEVPSSFLLSSENTATIPVFSEDLSQTFDLTKREGPDLSFAIFHPEIDGQDLLSAQQNPEAASVDRVADFISLQTVTPASGTENPAAIQKKKIQPLDCEIESQPFDLESREIGYNADSGPSELGLDLSLSKFSSRPSDFNQVKRLGNLGFEFFKSPSPAVSHSSGLKIVSRLDQAAPIAGNGTP